MSRPSGDDFSFRDLDTIATALNSYEAYLVCQGRRLEDSTFRARAEKPLRAVGLRPRQPDLPLTEEQLERIAIEQEESPAPGAGGRGEAGAPEQGEG